MFTSDPNPTEFIDLRENLILPFFSKIVEKIIQLQLKDSLYQNSLFPAIQSGFWKGHSCTMALLHVADHIMYGLSVISAI